MYQGIGVMLLVFMLFALVMTMFFLTLQQNQKTDYYISRFFILGYHNLMNYLFQFFPNAPFINPLYASEIPFPKFIILLLLSL